MGRKPVITVDGPAGAGKSTISRLLAQGLSYIYLDTGALYRAVAYRLAQAGATEDGQESETVLARMQVTLGERKGQLRVFVDGEDVSEKIRTEEIGLLASRTSARQSVRAALLSVQRAIGREGGVVAEGRDMGTVVFPDAEYKFYLDASVQERAARRYRELQLRGETANLVAVEAGILTRDRQDRERAHSPLRIPAGAVIIDTTNMTIPQVVERMRRMIKTGDGHHG
jgi:cytidylate kinase